MCNLVRITKKVQTTWTVLTKFLSFFNSNSNHLYLMIFKSVLLILIMLNCNSETKLTIHIPILKLVEERPVYSMTLNFSFYIFDKIWIWFILEIWSRAWTNELSFFVTELQKIDSWGKFLCQTFMKRKKPENQIKLHLVVHTLGYDEVYPIL